MQSAPKLRDKMKVADVVVSTNHVTFRQVFPLFQ